eukprot:scaffold3282_cov198-Alexandrium_tamarense.AAC.47
MQINVEWYRASLKFAETEHQTQTQHNTQHNPTNSTMVAASVLFTFFVAAASSFVKQSHAFTISPLTTRLTPTTHLFVQRQTKVEDECEQHQHFSRRSLIQQSANILPLLCFAAIAQPVDAKCTDIESCREEGERRVEADLKLNPITKLSDGVRYKVLRPPSVSSGPSVSEGSIIDLAYSINANGRYAYSQGFGYEKVQFGEQLTSDLGLDSKRITIGKHNVPIGIENALIGMKRGERRRVELPPGTAVGFESSNWQPEPTTRNGKFSMEQYRKILNGFGSQPPFPAETVWDIEVLGIR